MSSLRRRLGKLEAPDRDAGGCPECGSGSGEFEYVVEWGNIGDPPAPEPEPCGTCGQPREIIVEWDIGPPSVEGGGR